MRPVSGFRHRQIRTGGFQCGAQARDEVPGQKRRVAGRGDEQRRLAGEQSRVQAGQRAGEAGDAVGHHRVAEDGVLLQVLVGIDEEGIDLRRQALDRPRCHRLAAEGLQTLVASAHAATEAAGENQAGNLHVTLAADLRKRSAPVNSR